MAYAHATIEDPRDGKKYFRGDEVPSDLPGYDDLVEGGSVSETEYDPQDDVIEPVAPDTIEIDGVVYQKAAEQPEQEPGVQVEAQSADGAEANDERG